MRLDEGLESQPLTGADLLAANRRGERYGREQSAPPRYILVRPPQNPAGIRCDRRVAARMRRLSPADDHAVDARCPHCDGFVEIAPELLAASVFVGQSATDGPGPTRAEVWDQLRAGACGCRGRL